MFAVALTLTALAACASDPEPLRFDNTTAATTTLGAANPETSVPPSLPTSAGSAGSAPESASPATAPAGSTASISSDGPAVDDGIAAAWTDAAGNLAGMESECGNLPHLSVRPGRDELIAGVSLHGLWSSTDGGQTWSALGQGEGSAVIENRTSAIVYDPEHPDTYWESGLYNLAGIYRTDDGGDTFQEVGDITHSDLVSIDFTDPERLTMLSGRHEEPVLFRSTDGGASWTDISASLPLDIGYAAAPHVIDAQTHLLGTRTGTLSGVFRTNDGGATWTEVYAGGVNGPPLLASDGAIYWLREGGHGVISSDDLGVTWTDMGGLGVGANASTLVELPDGRFATYNDTNQVIVSSDRGQTWETVSASLPYEPSGITYSPEQQALYAWRFVCNFDSPNTIMSNSIMRLDFPAPPAPASG